MQDKEPRPEDFAYWDKARRIYEVARPFCVAMEMVMFDMVGQPSDHKNHERLWEEAQKKLDELVQATWPR